MNEIVSENRHKIGTACQLCFHAIGRYNRAVDAFYEKKNDINASLVYSQMEKERRINIAEGELSNTANIQYNEISRNLEDIRTAGKKLEELLDLGADLQNALSVIKTLGKATPVDIRLDLVKQFKGQKKALSVLKSAYEVAGLDANTYFEGVFFDIEHEVAQLDDIAYSIVAQNGPNASAALALGRRLEAYAESVGVELTKRFTDVIDVSAEHNRNMRAVMGISVD